MSTGKLPKLEFGESIGDDLSDEIEEKSKLSREQDEVPDDDEVVVKPSPSPAALVPMRDEEAEEVEMVLEPR